MNVLSDDSLEIRRDTDVVACRQAVRARSVEQGFSLVDQTKIVTAASEIARNTLQYGGGGTVRIQKLENGLKKGLRLIFEDKGPGISDIEQAMQDGFTTGGGLGKGLGGTKRLVNEFDLWSKPGEGTRITITRWK
jgi:serine/threonine-protein kinase RsbT